ncbi:MAG: hypothetical protein AAFX99_17240 [Myxococcota bacterium]
MLTDRPLNQTPITAIPPILVALGLLLSAPTAVQAQQGSSTVRAGHDTEGQGRFGPVHFGIGLKTGMNLNVISPPDVSPVLNPPIPAFVGNGGGVGLSVEALYADIVGLQLELWRTSGYGEGSFTFIGTNSEVTVDQRLETSELQMPILVKGQLPLKWFKPHIGFGVTVVWQLDASYSVDNPDVTTEIVDPPTDTYTMLTAQLGGSIDLGSIRIPIELRALYHPLDRDPAQRASFDFYSSDRGLILSSFSVNATWEAQFWMMVGVQYWDRADL